MPSILLTTPIFPPDIGGPATYVPKVADALVHQGWDVTVFTLSNDCWADDSMRGYKVLREPRDVAPGPRRVRCIAKIAALAHRADMVYANGIVMESALAARMVRRPLLQKFVGDVVWEQAHAHGQTSLHLDAFMAAHHPWKLELKAKLRNWWLSQGAVVVVPSQYLANLLHNHCDVSRDRLRVIYNGVTMPQAALSRMGQGDVMRIVTSSRLVSHKFVEHIIANCSALPHTQLTVIGDGPERARLEALAASLGGRTAFMGQMPRDEALRCMAAHDVFVLNSVYEGLPHVAIEAMALGLPVVATAVGGTPEVVRDGENGFLIPPGENAAAMCAALNTLRTDRGIYTRCGAEAIQTAKKFSDAAMLEQTTQLLKELLR